MPTFTPAELSPLLVLAVVAVIAALGGLLPYSPTEAVLLAVAAVAPTWLLLPAVAVATVSQMSTKALLFTGSGKAGRNLSERKRALVEKVRSRLAGRRWLQFLTVLVSAFVGVPPFYMVTMVCGALRLSIRDYLLAGTTGRAVRFSAVALLPQLFAAS